MIPESLLGKIAFQLLKQTDISAICASLISQLTQIYPKHRFGYVLTDTCHPIGNGRIIDQQGQCTFNVYRDQILSSVLDSLGSQIFRVSPDISHVLTPFGLSSFDVGCPIIVRHHLYGVLFFETGIETDFLHAIQSLMGSMVAHLVALEDTQKLYHQHTHLKGSLEKMASSQLTKFRSDMELVRHQDTLKTQFLSKMSHDLRTPLHVMVGMHSLLSTASSPPDPEAFRLLVKSCDQLESLITQILSPPTQGV